MPWPGADRASPRTTLAALSLAMSIGQIAADSPVVVTVPLHQSAAHPSYPPYVSISGDGRFVAFVSAAQLLPEDTNDRDDIYVLNRESGDVSLETAGVALAALQRPAISETGRFLVYETDNHVLMIRDRAGEAVRPLQHGREPPDGPSRTASMSADGRYVAFASGATNLVDGADANGMIDDVYLADTTSMTFRRISTGAAGTEPKGGSAFAPAISENGRFVAFSSTAPIDARAAASRIHVLNIYLYDTQGGATSVVTVGSGGGTADGSSYSPAISGDGRYVAFVSNATNLARRRDRNRTSDVYLRDTIAGTTELISRTPSGDGGNGASRHPVMSADGRYVVFQSEASDLACGERCAAPDRDINLVADIFRRDRQTGRTELISRGRTPWMEPSIGPAVDRTGAIIAFASRHALDQADDRHDYDLFVWSRAPRR